MCKLRVWFVVLLLVVDSQPKHRVFYSYNHHFEQQDDFVNETVSKVHCEVNTLARPCSWSPIVQLRLLKDLSRPFIELTSEDILSKRIMLHQTFNFCTITKSAGMDLFLKLGHEMFKESINFNISCPFKKGFYEAKAFKLDYGFMLNAFPLNQGRRFSSKIKQRVGKAMVDIFVFQMDFEIVEVDN